MPKAIICENNKEIQKLLSDYLKSLGFECLSLSDTDAGMINLEDVSLIIAGQNCSEIIRTVSSLPMYQRREIIVILLSNSISTMDRISAFIQGVDFIVNVKDLNNFPAIFKKAYAEHQRTYKQFKETLSRLFY